MNLDNIKHDISVPAWRLNSIWVVAVAAGLTVPLSIIGDFVYGPASNSNVALVCRFLESAVGYASVVYVLLDLFLVFVDLRFRRVPWRVLASAMDERGPCLLFAAVRQGRRRICRDAGLPHASEGHLDDVRQSG
ncbi:MAG: hypothetical protein U0610_03130 [bacterium]